MGIHYIIHKSADNKVNIHAEKINLGLKRLWFYDAEDNLLAVFRWDAIEGFSIEGPASGQIVIEDLAHEKKVRREKAESLEQSAGPILAALEVLDQSLQDAANAVSTAWLKVHDAQSHKSEAKLLVSNRRGDLLRYQVRLQDYAQDLGTRIKRIIDEISAIMAADR
jgi:hypothetical protein